MYTLGSILNFISLSPSLKLVNVGSKTRSKGRILEQEFRQMLCRAEQTRTEGSTLGWSQMLTDGRTNVRKTGSLYHTMLKAGATKSCEHSSGHSFDPIFLKLCRIKSL